MDYGELYDQIYSFKDYEEEAQYFRGIIDSKLGGRAACVLDVACGTGKHLERFSQWYEVEGIDLSDEQLRIARGRLPDVPLHRADMRDFHLEKRFDVVLCLFGSIGYCLNLEELERCFGCLAQHVAPGGVALVEPWFEPDAWKVGKPSLLVYQEEQLKIARASTTKRVGDHSIIEFHYLLAKPKGVEYITKEHRLCLFTHAQLCDAAKRAGLDPVIDRAGPMGRGLLLAAKPA